MKKILHSCEEVLIWCQKLKSSKVRSEILFWPIINSCYIVMQCHHVLSYDVECYSYNFIGQSAGVDKKALVRASKHTDKCYDNLIGQERIDRGVDYIIAIKRSTVHELVTKSTGMYGNQTMVHIHKCTCYSKKKTISELKTVILSPPSPSRKNPLKPTKQPIHTRIFIYCGSIDFHRFLCSVYLIHRSWSCSSPRCTRLFSNFQATGVYRYVN